MVLGHDKNYLLKNAELLVLSSLQEEFGIAVAEVMGAGWPVVINEELTLSKEVDASNAGIVIKFTVENILEAILLLLQNKEKCKIMGIHAYEFTKVNYSKKT